MANNDFVVHVIFFMPTRFYKPYLYICFFNIIVLIPDILTILT